MNAANEVAVAAFLDNLIRFDQIHAINAGTLDALNHDTPGSLEDLLALDLQARRVANTLLARYAD